MDPFSAPPSTPISVVVPDEPRKRRTGRYIAVVVIAALAIGGVVFAVTRGDDKPTYSLTAAKGATDDVNSYRFLVTTEALGSEVTVEVESDDEQGLAHLLMDFGGGTGIPVKLEMIVDVESKATYVNRSFYDAIGIPLDTEWLRMDDEWLQQNGQGSIFDVETPAGPLEATAFIDKAVKTEDLGFDEVNGVKVKHYRVTFRGEDVVGANPNLESQLDGLDGTIPDQVVYEMYVDEQNIVRRVSYQMDIGPGEITTDIVMLAINEPLQFELPADKDVTDASDLLG